MNSKIVIKEKNIQEKKIYSNRSDSVYSLIDKPYYVDAMRYKVEWWKFTRSPNQKLIQYLWDILLSDPHLKAI